MKKVFVLVLVFVQVLACSAQIKGRFYNEDQKALFVINLERDTIDVPGLEGLETCYGVLSGNLNGRWIILKVKSQKESSAVVRVTCDRGNDAEDITLTLRGDELIMQQKDNYIKCVQGKKYAKLPKQFIFKRIQ